MTTWFRILVILGLALALASAGEVGKTRVKGKAFGNPSKPPVTNRPPPDRTADDEAYDVDDGMHPAGTFAYELRQGERLENKGKFAKTDYIEWQINGAKLRGSGKVHDKDSAAATIASSEAWGAEFITVIATTGKWAWIGADNRVSFHYNYLVSGGTIAEASVQLQGNAFDINGKKHTFNLSDQRVEGVGSEQETKTGLDEKEYANLRISTTLFGNNVGGDAGAEKETYSELNAKVSRRYATAGGDNNNTPTVVVQRSVAGRTPLEETFSVFSDATVTLRARAGKVPDGEEESMVLVELLDFTVSNELTAYKATSDEPFEPPDLDPPPPPPSPGHAPGPTTPPESGGPDGPETPSDDDQSDNNSLGPVELLVSAPHGLDGETGCLPGWLTVALSKSAASDAVFDVDPGPLLDCVEAVVVRAGRRFVTIPLLAKSAGSGTVVVSCSDAPVASVGVMSQSLADIPDARLWAVAPSRAGSAVTLRALAGRVAVLWVGRLGFAGIDDEETVVSVIVEDPAGILGVPPTDVTIPAGKTLVPLALDPVAAGTARLRLVAGADVIEVTIVIDEQAWDVPERIRIPVGATVALPVRLRHAEDEARMVTAAVVDSAVASSGADTELRAGEVAWFLRVRGAGLGTTSVQLSTPGLPDRTVLIEVVAARIVIEQGVLVVSGLTGLSEGTIELWVGEAACIAGLDLPQGCGMRLEGLGSAHVALHIDPDPDRPEELRLPIRFGGAPSEVGVLDTRDAEETAQPFHLELR